MNENCLFISALLAVHGSGQHPTGLRCHRRGLGHRLGHHPGLQEGQPDAPSDEPQQDQQKGMHLVLVKKSDVTSTRASLQS